MIRNTAGVSEAVVDFSRTCSLNCNAYQKWKDKQNSITNTTNTASNPSNTGTTTTTTKPPTTTTTTTNNKEKLDSSKVAAMDPGY
jgi:hypothetical protein